MSGAQKYRKKPVVIEAMQMPFDSRNGDPSTDEYHALGSEMARRVRDVAVWMVENGYDGNPDDEDVDEWEEQFTQVIDGERVGLPEFGINFLEINTLEGEMHASPGDYIIKGTEGEFYPCKPAAFAATFEEVAA